MASSARSLGVAVAIFAIATAASAQSAVFPAAMWGIRFGGPASSMRTRCAAEGGTWEPGGWCLLGAGTPERRIVAEVSYERRVRELTSLWESVAPPGDRGPWVDFFLRRHAELTRTYGPSRPVFSTDPACAARLVERRDPSCITSAGTRVVLAWNAGRGQVRLEMYALADVDRVRETWYAPGRVPPDQPDLACEWP